MDGDEQRLGDRGCDWLVLGWAQISQSAPRIHPESPKARPALEGGLFCFFETLEYGSALYSCGSVVALVQMEIQG